MILQWIKDQVGTVKVVGKSARDSETECTQNRKYKTKIKSIKTHLTAVLLFLSAKTMIWEKMFMHQNKLQ